MFDENFQEPTSRHSRRMPTNLLAALSLIIGMALGVGLVLGWQWVAHTGTPATPQSMDNTPAAPQSTTNASSDEKGSGPTSKDNDRPQYFWDTLKAHTAQGIHLSVAQVKAKLRTGQHIQDIAAAQGVSLEQLHTIEINAFQAADNEMVRHGFTTQANIGYDMQRWRQEETMQLNADVMNAFLQR